METSPVSSRDIELVLRLVRMFKTLDMRTLIAQCQRCYGIGTLDVCVAVDELEESGVVAVYGQTVSLPW